MSHGIAGIVSRRCHSLPLLQLPASSDTWALHAPVWRGYLPEHEPWIAKVQSICCSVVAMRKVDKNSSGARCQVVVWASDAQAPGPRGGRSVGGPEAVISPTQRHHVFQRLVKVSLVVV